MHDRLVGARRSVATTQAEQISPKGAPSTGLIYEIQGKGAPGAIFLFNK